MGTFIWNRIMCGRRPFPATLVVAVVVVLVCRSQQRCLACRRIQGFLQGAMIERGQAIFFLLMIMIIVGIGIIIIVVVVVFNGCFLIKRSNGTQPRANPGTIVQGR